MRLGVAFHPIKALRAHEGTSRVQKSRENKVKTSCDLAVQTHQDEVRGVVAPHPFLPTQPQMQDLVSQT